MYAKRICADRSRITLLPPHQPERRPPHTGHEELREYRPSGLDIFYDRHWARPLASLDSCAST